MRRREDKEECLIEAVDANGIVNTIIIPREITKETISQKKIVVSLIKKCMVVNVRQKLKMQ